MLVFTKIEKTMVVSISGKDVFYRWTSPEMKFIMSPRYTASILHNFQSKAMLDFEDNNTKQSVYRCEINPLHYKGDEWVVDYYLSNKTTSECTDDVSDCDSGPC